jgi:hypothetical protein
MTQMLLNALVTAVASGTVVAAIVGVLATRRDERIRNELRLQFDQLAARATSGRLWRERSVSELLGPINMQLDRTERAFNRWRAQNLFLEAKVLREANQTIRDLLLQKGHLIPPDLLEDAGRLIEHYDRWLEEFERVRGAQELKLEEPFVFVGVGSHPVPFPREAADRFQARYGEMWRELYEPQNGPGSAAV